jgi:hypothetical protein
MGTHNYTYYNPETNEIQTGKRYSGDGFICLGAKKIAEAFTSVDPEERPKLWASLHGKSYGFDLRMLNSKLRHKLKKLGIDLQFSDRRLSDGEELLKAIEEKKGI